MGVGIRSTSYSHLKPTRSTLNCHHFFWQNWFRENVHRIYRSMFSPPPKSPFSDLPIMVISPPFFHQLSSKDIQFYETKKKNGVVTRLYIYFWLLKTKMNSVSRLLTSSVNVQLLPCRFHFRQERAAPTLIIWATYFTTFPFYIKSFITETVF